MAPLHSSRALAALALLLLTLAPLLPGQEFTTLAHGTRGMAPLEYRALWDSAISLQNRQAWREAAALYDRLVGAYPNDPRTWHSLAYTRRQAGEHRAAAQAYAQAVRLGTAISGRAAPMNAAREYARAGEADSALTWLARALHDHKVEGPLTWLADSAFATLRADERYRRLTPPSTTGADRVAGWGVDVDYLLTQHRRLNQAADPVPQSMVRDAEALKARIGSLTDYQVMVELQRLVARLGRSHNGFDLCCPPEQWGVKKSPLNAYLFGDSVYVIRADSAHRDLVGARIVAVEGTSMAEVLVAASTLNPAEGEPNRDFAAHAAVDLALLHALGFTPQADRMMITVVDRSGRTRRAEVTAGRGIGFYDYLPPSPFATVAVPLHMRQEPSSHWFQHLPEHRAVYVRVKNIHNTPGAEPMNDFALRLRRFLDEHREVRNVIVDVRRNSGGNTYLYGELLRTLIAFDTREDAALYALMDRRVYSAGMNFLIDLDRLTNALLVGEATGASVEQHGDGAMLRLPYSGLPVRVSTTIWNISSPHDDRRWIAPDVPVALTAADYFAHRDPVMDTVLEFIARR